MKSSFYFALRSLWWRHIKGPLKGNTFSTGLCFSCGQKSYFMYSHEIKDTNIQIGSDGGLSEEFMAAAAEDENHCCTLCMKNRRTRTHAKAVLETMECKSQEEFAHKLKQQNLCILEAAHESIFFSTTPLPVKNYILSCFFGPELKSGSIIKNRRHENLESLSFENASLDMVITSAVLEHVNNLESAFKEIHRVLKPGGSHIFAVPIDSKLKCSRRRAELRNNETINLFPPIFHGDTLLDKKILVYHDFGADFAKMVNDYGFKIQPFSQTDSGLFGVPIFMSKKI